MLDAKEIDIISIHALREEGDFSTPQYVELQFEFLSTPSARRATHRLKGRVSCRLISIHALREEGDSKYAQFNPAYLHQFAYKLMVFPSVRAK